MKHVNNTVTALAFLVSMILAGSASIMATGCGNSAPKPVIASIPPAQENQLLQSQAQAMAAYRQSHPFNKPGGQ
jgi:hypothetical protein